MSEPNPNNNTPQTLLGVGAVAATLGAAFTGLLIGATIAWLVKPPVIQQKTVPRDYTEAELEAACKPLVAQAVATASEAKVQSLTEQVQAKQAKVQELEAEMKRRGQAGRAMAAELKSAKSELSELREQLVVAIQEKVTALRDLQKAVQKINVVQKELNETKIVLEDTKEVLLDNRWERFIQEAQLTICEKGNRKKLGNCRQVVEASLIANQFEPQFRHCLASNQATPNLVESSYKRTVLPDYAYWLNPNAKQTRDWYILFCDPSLPEASDTDATAPSTQQDSGAQ